jgi:hypothetical protein
MRMRMRHVVVALGLAWSGSTALADTFGGFSGVDRPYLVNQDRVCTPIKVANDVATGAPACEKAATDVIAKLSIKDPLPQTGPKAKFAATASGRTLTVTAKDSGATLVTWSAPDSIGKVVAVYGSQYDDRVAVAYTTRRLGKEVTDVIGFDLGQGAATVKDPIATPPVSPTSPTTAPPPAPPEDPKLTKALAAARKAGKPKALAAWQAVLAIDTSHTEALYRVAAAQLAKKQTADAMSSLAVLAASTKPDAIEWLVEARFDPAFAALRADPKFRSTVGLDRKPGTAYEKMMGFGGQWEQTGTSCDKPEIRFTALRDRTFKLRVKTVCQGSVFDTPFRGTWRIDNNAIVLTLPNKGKAVTAADQAGCGFETVVDEDALRCHIGRDLEFTVLPTRR